MRRIILASVFVVAACAPSAATPSASSSPAPTVAPTPTPTARPTASPSPSPSATPIPQPTFVTLSAPSADVVWALVAGTHLFRSTDRGATWQERALPSTAQIVDMAFINDREGWIVVVGPALCEPQAITTYHTADGAATWDAGSAPSDNSCKGGLFFADAQRGWLTTFSTAAAPSFLRTADGGKTWTRSSPLADPPGFTTQPGGFTLRPGRVRAFGSELLVWAIGQSQTGGTGFVFRSTDEGATWKHLSTAPQAFGAVVFITATRWIQLLDAPNTGETTDAGRSWHPLATDYQQAAPVAPEVVFADASVGYATVRGSIQRTTDGGAHWSAIKTPGT